MSGKQWAVVVVGVVISVLQSAGYARAGALQFGTDERVRAIQPTKDPRYKLAYKVTIYFFVAGCYVTDGGYVLQNVNGPKSYISLDAAMIQQLQREGTLPTPLPPIPWISYWDYLYGYSNWLILGFVVGILLTKWAWARARGKQAEARPTDRSNAEPGTTADRPRERAFFEL